MAIPLAIMGLSGFQAYEQYKAGNEAKRSYDEIAAEELRAGRAAQQIGLAQQIELAEEGASAIGQARAAASKSGLRVGGSVLTLTQRIANKVARRKLLVGLETAEQMRAHSVRADQYRSAGRSAKSAGGRQAVMSLLTGGLAAGSYMYQTGMFSSPLSKSGGMSGISGQGYWMYK